MSVFPELYSIGNSGKLQRMEVAEYDNDPRGILWIWEPPDKSRSYCMGIDPTVGRTGWNRYNRVREDRKTDNGAIEVLRIGRRGAPDVQVAEYASPVDPFELGDVANLIGRLYAGQEEDQCKAIPEITGPGFAVLQRLLDSGYTNIFQWEYYGDSPAMQTRSIRMGWHATRDTNQDLWVKASRHLNLKQVIIKSPFLAEEYADCRMNVEKGWAENPGGHDDRVRAMNLAIWQANGWSFNVERTQEVIKQDEGFRDWQMSDMMPDEIMGQWGMALDRMGGNG